jgi:hypothetical protein
MIKAVPKRTFLLRRENNVDVIAKRGEFIMITAEELKKFKVDFIVLKK